MLLFIFVPDLARVNSSWLFCPSDTPIVLFYEFFLLSCMTRSTRHILYFPALSLDSVIPPKNQGFCKTKMTRRSQGLVIRVLMIVVAVACCSASFQVDRAIHAYIFISVLDFVRLLTPYCRLGLPMLG